MSLAVPMLLAAVASPQVAREPVQGGPTSTSHSLMLASDADLSAAVWGVNTDTYPPPDEIFLSVSDGRGLAWSAPQTVELAPAGVSVSGAHVRVVEDRAFVAWCDLRYGVPRPFLRVYDAATGALGPEIEIPTGAAASAGLLGLDAERVGTAVHVYTAIVTYVQPPAGPGFNQLVVATSIDGGASFLPPLVRTLPAPLPTAFSFFTHAMQVESGVVHVMWLDRRKNKTQVFYQRSSDGGLSFDFAEDRQLTDLEYVLSFRLDARGSTLAFAVDETFDSDHYPDYDFADVSAAVSTDGGTTFSPVQSVPLLSPSSGELFNPAIAVGSGGEVLLAWENGFSSPSARAARTVDGGATWSSEMELAADVGEFPVLLFAGPGRDRAVVAWRGVAGKPRGRLSSDAGVSWGPTVELGAQMSGQSPAQVVFNDRYQNLIASWRDNLGTNPVFIGGFRPQTLTPSGFTAGATQIGAAFERFDDGSPLAFFLLSTAPGDLLLPFGDLRNTGLGLTPLFLTSVSLTGGPFAAALDPAGAGALAPLPAFLLSPLTLYAVGVAFDPLTLGFGDLSDVVRIDL